jgi:tetratricopeptide (TPR) repeat protein
VFKEALAAVRSRDGDWHIADHEILDEIARGGMGVVYQAKEPHSERIVALKCVLAYHGDSDHVVARFRREAETAARLDHPNIVPIYQVGETADGFPYYTMKYAPAGSLLQARGPLLEHPRRSVQLLMKVARAVHYAHEKGVLHRDLKPGNILLDEHGEPLVSDFGLARCEATSGYLTRSLASFGTPGYIAPEQADGPAARLTAAADVYSLGAILFELLAGRPPFIGDNAFAVMKQSAENRAPKVRMFARNVDRDLETICERCLEREPGDRYPSAAALAEDLQRWLEDRPIAARRASLWRHSRRWVRHNRWVAALLVAFCLLGAGSFAWHVRAQRIQGTMRETVLAQRSVVVLPFLDLDGVTPDTHLANAIAIALREQLGALGPARVVAGLASSSGRTEDILKASQEAKTRTVLAGTVRKVNGKRRIAFRLLNAATGEPLFATLWEEDEKQPLIAGASKDLGKTFYPILSSDDWSSITQSRVDPALRNDEAKEAIKSGREWLSRYTVADADKAIALFEKAIRAEPNSALAHAYLAIAVTGRTHFLADPHFLERGKTEANKALELSPQSPDAHRALAGVYYQEEKYREALEAQLRTIEMGGLEARVTTFVGMTLNQLGHPDKALSWYKLSSRLQTTPGDIDPLIGDSWVHLGDDDEAGRAYDRAIELRPGSSRGIVGKCHLQILQGNFEAVREICRSRLSNRGELGEMTQIAAQIEFFARNFPAAEELYSKLAAGDADGGGSFYGAISYQSALGRIRQDLGPPEMAEGILRECLAKETLALNRHLDNPVAAYQVAAVEASLNLHDAAFQHLRQAVKLGWLDYRSPRLDPRFDSLRSDPEFTSLIDEVSSRAAEIRVKTKAIVNK